jgi:hypothetical protein
MSGWVDAAALAVAAMVAAVVTEGRGHRKERFVGASLRRRRCRVPAP